MQNCRSTAKKGVERVWGSEGVRKKARNWVSEQLNRLKSKWKSAKWCKQTSSMWRALIGSIKHEERRERGSKKLIKRRHYLISSSFVRMWLINLKKWKRTTRQAEERKLLVRRHRAPVLGRSCVYITHLPQRPGKLFFNTRHEKWVIIVEWPSRGGNRMGKWKMSLGVRTHIVLKVINRKAYKKRLSVMLWFRWSR